MSIVATLVLSSTYKSIHMTCTYTTQQCPTALLSLSGGGQLLRSWEMSTGVLKWELSLELPAMTNKRYSTSIHRCDLEVDQSLVHRNYPLDTSWRPGSALATLAGKNGG